MRNTFFVAGALLAVTAGCSNRADQLVGKWEKVGARGHREFFYDGTVVMSGNFCGKWEFDRDGRLKIERQPPGSEPALISEVTFDGDKMTSTSAAGQVERYQRVSAFTTPDDEPAPRRVVDDTPAPPRAIIRTGPPADTIEGVDKKERKQIFTDLFRAVDRNGPGEACKQQWTKIAADHNLTLRLVGKILEEGFHDDWTQPEFDHFTKDSRANRMAWIKSRGLAGREPMLGQ